MNEIVIVGAARTPVGSFNGAFAGVAAHDLGSTAISAALDRGGIVRIAPVQFAMPVVSLILAVVLLGETLTLPLIASTVIIVSGIVFARKG